VARRKLTNQDVANFLVTCSQYDFPSILSAANLADVLDKFKEPIIALEPSLALAPHESFNQQTHSCFTGGQAASFGQEWPVDKNAQTMKFVGEVDFARLPPLNESAPKEGVLMLFLSPTYRGFRAKEAGWFKVLFGKNNGQADYHAQLNTEPLLVFKPRATFYLPLTAAKAIASACSQGDHNLSGQEPDWATINSFICTFNEHFVGSHYILGEPGVAAKQSLIVAAFHANGISYDDKRRNDPHYAHLIEDAASWTVLWKIGELASVFPGENRELYICIRKDDLQEGDISKCSPVFL
jgi:uncharacterized protein YwqG